MGRMVRQAANTKVREALKVNSREMKRTKQRNWQDFVSNERNEDVWSFPYRFLFGKVKQNIALCALSTLGWTDTAEELLKSLVLFDCFRDPKAKRHSKPY